MWSGTSKIIALLLVLSLAAVVFTQVFDRTALSSRYIEGKLTTVDGYSRLSEAISTELTREAYAAYPNLPDSEQVLITPEALQLKVQAFLAQFQQYVHGDASAPVLDLRDLVGQSQAAGLPIPADSSLAKPFQLPATGLSSSSLHNFDSTKRQAIILSALLAIVLGAVCYKRRRYQALADVAMWTGVLVGVSALMLTLTSGVIERQLHLTGGAAVLAGVLGDLAAAIMSGAVSQLSIVGLVLFAAGLTARIAIGRFQSHS